MFSAPSVACAMIDDTREVEVVVAHLERVTLRVGDVFLKIDTDQARIDREVEVMARAPIPTPEVLWRKPPVLALAAVPGAALGVLDEPSHAPSAAWVAAGAAVRRLHDAPLLVEAFTHEEAQGVLFTFAGAWPALGRDAKDPSTRFVYMTIGELVCRFRGIELAPGAIVVDDVARL